MDRSLDEIVNERHNNAPRGPRRGGRRNERNDYPRDGVRKSTREESRNLDSEWVHDKYDDDKPRGGPARRGRYSPDRSYGTEPESSKLKVENIHYDLTEVDLDDLFNRIGAVEKLVLTYDRAGRSNGIAYVTYERVQDAKRAIREFDGANANGQPIRLTLVGGRPARNPFDNVVRPPRPLADRITMPGRSRSLSPIRHSDVSGPPPEGVDRYVPARNGRSRSPLPRRRGDGRRPGARRERGDRVAGAGNRPTPRPKKTQEELDAEMDDYWGGGSAAKEANANSSGAASGAEKAAPVLTDDIEMAE